MTQWRPILPGSHQGRLIARRGHRCHRVPRDPARQVRLAAAPLGLGIGETQESADRLRPDVVHAHFGGDGWLISRSAARLRPLIITLHGLDVTRQADRPPTGPRHRRNPRKAFRPRDAHPRRVRVHPRKAIALSAPTPRRYAYTTHGVPIPPAPSAAPPAEVGRHLFVGRFVEKKGIDDLIGRLWACSRSRGHEPSSSAAGRWNPRCASVPRHSVYMRHSWGCRSEAVFGAWPSRSFASPSKDAHAPRRGRRRAADDDSEASLGLPTVSTYHSGIPEAVVHGETGLLCEEGDSPCPGGEHRSLSRTKRLCACDLLPGAPSRRSISISGNRRGCSEEIFLLRDGHTGDRTPAGVRQRISCAAVRQAAGCAAPPRGPSVAPPGSRRRTPGPPRRASRNR